MDNLFMVLVGVVMALAFGFLAGTITTDGAWQRDCEKINAHVAMEGKVFSCFQQEPK